jgi:hypothetical protein
MVGRHNTRSAPGIPSGRPERDAILFSVSANGTHGQRRTNEDKRRAVLCLLNDPEWAADTTPEAFAASMNLHRRHGEAQTVMAAWMKEYGYGEPVETVGKALDPVWSPDNVSGRGVAAPAQARAPNLGALRSSAHGGRRRDTPGLVDGGTDRT